MLKFCLTIFLLLVVFIADILFLSYGITYVYNGNLGVGLPMIFLSICFTAIGGFITGWTAKNVENIVVASTV